MTDLLNVKKNIGKVRHAFGRSFHPLLEVVKLSANSNTFDFPL
jgi:predicted aldo/keto reductase-like oxidoreductase